MIVESSNEYQTTLKEVALRFMWYAIENEGVSSDIFVTFNSNIEFIADFFGVSKMKVESDLATAMMDVNVGDLQTVKLLKQRNRLN